jgi:hypothetical protein
VLVLGRVTTGPGGDVIIHQAKEVLRLEFPDLAGRIAFHVPDEKDKRHGQAIAARQSARDMSASPAIISRRGAF